MSFAPLYVTLLRNQGALALPSKPGLVRMLFHELGARHLQVPLPSQNLLFPQETFCVTLLPPPQEPLEHISPVLQGLPSSQEPVLLDGAGQPLAGTQVPAIRHWPEAVHVTALPPPHVPFD